MKIWIEDRIIWIGEHSTGVLWSGISLILLATCWDFILYGVVRSFNMEYALCWKGVVVCWLGVLLITLAWKIENDLNG